MERNRLDMESTWPTGWPNIGPDDDLHTFDPTGDVLLQLVSWGERCAIPLDLLVAI